MTPQTTFEQEIFRAITQAGLRGDHPNDVAATLVAHTVILISATFEDDVDDTQRELRGKELARDIADLITKRTATWKKNPQRN